jgi:hypothetical protein
LPATILIKPVRTAQIEGMGVETVSRLAFGTLDFGFFHRWRDRPDNALGHLVLQIEDVAEPTIKPSAQRWAPVAVSTSCPVMRTRFAALRTLPSNT